MQNKAGFMRFREHRFPCEMPARLDHAGRGHAVSVVNISPHGARISGAESLPIGAEVRLSVLAHLLHAEVRWVRGRLAGLRLSEPLSPATLATIRQARAAPVSGRVASARGRSFGAGLMELR